jgi:3-dehydroquinate dehydratase/shikimate dehydrogenase
MERTTDAALALMHSLPPQVDMVELRLDAMAECDLSRLCAGRDRAIIVTDRPVRQGGRSPRPERERLANLRRAAELGAEYVDVELDAVGELGELNGQTGKIVSHHDFQGTPHDLGDLVRRIRSTGADVAKIAVRANDLADVPPVLELLRTHGQAGPLIALSMGEEGVASRLLAGKFGAFLTFASAGADRESAPGQVPYDQMIGTYRFRRVGEDTLVYGVAANPVAHSMSPAVHNAAFAALDFSAVYVPFKVTDPAGFLGDFEPYDLHGLSVTIPHKEAMLELMDEVDELARRVGAVNTVRIDDGHRYGCNTDLSAAVEALAGAARRAGLYPLEGREVLLVGAGGAARAMAHGLVDCGAELTIANRTVERARALAVETGAAYCGLDEVPHLEPDVLINATSLGMWPRTDQTPVPGEVLRPGMVVFDSVYNPMRTRLLREAEEAGAVTASGVDWFVNQAAAQFELWTGMDAPREVMEEALTSRLAEE